MKDNDLVGSDAWSNEWKSRDKSFRSKLIKSMRQWALRDRVLMVEMFCKEAGADTRRINLIELGCAPGVMLEEVSRASSACNLSGLDYSEDGLEIAKQFLGEKGLEANLLCGDVRTYQPDKKYDLVVSFGLIEHFTNPEDILSAHKKFVLDEGVVAVTVPNFRPAIVQKALRKYRPETLETHNLDLMDEKVLYNLFERCGFVDIKTGGAIGPLLPTPDTVNSFSSRLYKITSMLWNGCVRVLPPRWTWYGCYWAYGRIK